MILNIWDYGIFASALFNIAQHQAVVKVGVKNISQQEGGETNCGCFDSVAQVDLPG